MSTYIATGNCKKMQTESFNRFLVKFNALRIRVLVLMLGDSICAAGIFWLVLWGYRFLGNKEYGLERYWNFLPFLLAFLICNSLFRCYHGSFFYPGTCLNKIEEIRRLSFSMFLTYLLIFTWLMFTRRGEVYSRLGLLISMCLTIPVLPVVRFMARYFMRCLGMGQIKILIAGAGETGKLISKEFENSCYYGFQVVGYLDDDPEKQGKSIEGYPVLGTLAAAQRISKKFKADYVVCCLPVNIISRTFQRYSRIFRHIMFIPDNRILPISWLYPASIGLFGGFEIRNQLLLSMPRLLKSLLEILLAFCAIVCLLPLFFILALIVKLSSPGPVFYFAKRLGVNGKNIKVLKFRTMYVDAEPRLERMLEENPELKAEWQKNFKLQDDPRITPVGRFLRKTSLDELPQFWNVLTGEMAVIGPRPIVKDEIKYYGETYEIRKRVKPGITGLWQVSGRSEVDYQHRVMLDMYYIMNWSIWMDYYIFFKTIYVVIARQGAC